MKNKRIVITSILVILSAILLFAGVRVFEGSQTRDITKATYYVGAAVVFAISLVPWTRE